MPNTYSAQDGYVGLAIQNAQGTFLSPTDFMLATSVDMNPTDSKIYPDPEIGSGRDVQFVDQGSYKVAGSVDAYMRHEAVGILVYGALGGYSASGEQNPGDGDYLHVFQPIASGELPWISMERSVSDANYILQEKDIKVNGFNLDASPNEYSTLSFDLVGISDAWTATPSVVTLDESPLIVGNGVTVEMNGVEFSVKTLSLKLSNNLVDDDFRLGSRFLGGIQERRRELTLNMDVSFDPSNELYRKAFYGDASATQAAYDVHAENVVITFDSREEIQNGGAGENYRWVIELPYCVFMAAPVKTSNDNLIVVPLELMAIKDSSVPGIMRVSIWNNKATY